MVVLHTLQNHTCIKHYVYYKREIMSTYHKGKVRLPQRT